MKTFNESEHPRQSSGRFAAKDPSTPDNELSDPADEARRQPDYDEHLNEADRAACEAALWSSVDWGSPDAEALDANYDIDDIADLTRQGLKNDLDGFIASNYERLDRIVEENPTYDWGNVGHDFWLTRNGHGAGFWDRALGEDGDVLTREAQAYGGVELGDIGDRKVHIL